MTYTLIRNATLIDGNGGAPLPNAAVLLKGNKIISAETEETITLPDADIRTLDAGGGFILPGLIDCHVHLLLEKPNLFELAQDPFSLMLYSAVGTMRRTLDAGITSVRDAGGADLGLKTAVERGFFPGPRMQISISILSPTSGHLDGWLRGGNTLAFLIEHPGRPNGIADGVAEVRKRTRQILRAGADVIKVCTTGGVLSPTDHPQFTNFAPDELAVIVQEARHRNGIKVMAHAQGMHGIKNAIRAGIHSIEHGIFLDEEAIEMMLENGTFLVPTLLAPVAVTEMPSLPAYALQQSREVVDIHRDSIRRAHKAGVKIAMGTDAGVMPHGTNLRELGLMVDVGLSPMEAIVATTRTAADCLGWLDRLGTLDPGKLADLIITRTNPLTDIRSLENNDNITHVFKDGEVVKGQ